MNNFSNNEAPLKRLALLLVLCSSMAWETMGQRPDLTFDHYSVEDGLSQSTVWNIFEDSKGFMWFCTPDGLNKFDGYSFTVYRHIKGDTNSISSDHILSIFEDSKGDLWIGHSGGLSKYHYQQDRFSNIPQSSHVTSEKDGLLPLYESEGKVWVWEERRGIIGFNRSTLKEEVMYAAPEKYFKNIKSYSRYSKTIGGKAFICTASDLMIVFDFQTLQYTFLFNKVLDPLYQGISATNKFAIDSLDNLWIPAKGGVIYLNTKTLKSTVYTDGFSGNYLTSCTIDSHGILWIGSASNGLYLMDINAHTIKNISKKNYKENGLLYNYIESLYTDSSDNIWVGTNGFGIQKFSKHKNKFDHFDLKIGTNSFGANLVKAIVEDDKGNIYVGTFGNGLYVIDKAGNVRNYSLPVDNNATAMIAYPNQNILISNGVTLFKFHNNAIAPVDVSIRNFTEQINSIYLIDDKEVLVATNVGVLSFKGLSHTYPVSIKWPSIQSLQTSTLYKDSKKRIWVGTHRSFYVVAENDTVPRAMDHITTNYIKSFHEDEHGNIWIATLGDLICYHPETGKAEYLSAKDGFANVFFYAALPGADRKIWVSSNKGLASYDPQTKKVKNYSVLDGLQSNEFNTGAYYKMKDGRLAFGGLNGLNIFDPTALQANPNLPKIAFTNFMVDDKPFKLDTSIHYKKQIDLSFGQNTFSFEFSGLEYTSPENNQYAYQLEGQDKDWVQGGNRRFVRYSRLAPGRYAFKVKASNSDGVWNEQPSTIIVNVLPPIYMETWFIIVMMVLTVVTIVLISVWVVRLRYRSRLRQLEVNQKVQLERGRISRDLHDHVGSQLTFIINQLDGGPQEVMMKGQLADARDAARTTMGNLRETIWALHRETITLVDLTDRIKEFAMKQLKAKREMQLDFNEKLDASHTFNPSKALNLFRIAQEVINNAIKHSNSSILSISIEHRDGLFKLMIIDNGRGFTIDPSTQSGYGLQNIAFRAKEIDATLSITSVPDQGTSVMVDLPISTP